MIQHHGQLAFSDLDTLSTHQDDIRPRGSDINQILLQSGPRAVTDLCKQDGHGDTVGECADTRFGESCHQGLAVAAGEPNSAAGCT